MESPAPNSSQPARPAVAAEGSRFWPLLLLAVVVLYVLAALFGDRGIMRELQHRRTLQSLNTELDKVSGRNEELRREIDALRSNGKYVETIARRELGMVKPDEIIYQFPPSGEKASTVRRPEGSR